MSDAPNPSVLPALIELSKVDIRISILTVEKKKLEADLVARGQVVQATGAKREAKNKVLGEKRALVAREEKAIKLERDKINERRRALSTLGNYKLQQAAEREITFTSKEIGKREDMLLGIMREVELLERDMAELDKALVGLQDELQAAEKEVAEAVQSISQQLAEAQALRTEKATVIGQGAVLTMYNRARDRFPSDPLVPVINRESCGGCHIRVGPQAVVQLSRGDVVKCQGCNRLLRLPDE